MMVLDLVGVILFMLLVLNFHLTRSKNENSFHKWIFMNGFIPYMIKFALILFIIGLIGFRIDWDFLTYKIF